jgi:beta-glucanase (GH16 family)
MVLTSALPMSNAASKKSLKLLWSQEFNGKKGTLPDKKVWSYDLGGGGWGNSERQFYTNKPTNISMNGSGQLVINARRISNIYGEQLSEEPGTIEILDRCSECQFTSSRIKTARKVSFMYGRIEARIKLPSGTGTWPAFWMLGGDLLDGVPWPECGEIDIMEYRGDYSDRSTSAIHGPNTPPGSGLGSAYLNYGPLSNDYHTFAIEWKKNTLTFYVDNRPHGTVSSTDLNGRWVFNQKFFLILNLAMGGTYAGEFIDPELMSAELKVDYIRFYSINGVGKVFQN